MVSLYMIDDHVATLRYHLGFQQEYTVYEAEVHSLKALDCPLSAPVQGFVRLSQHRPHLFTPPTLLVMAGLECRAEKQRHV